MSLTMKRTLLLVVLLAVLLLALIGGVVRTEVSGLSGLHTGMHQPPRYMCPPPPYDC